MGQVAAIGELVRVQGFALAGARVYPASDPPAVWAAWHSVRREVTLVILTPAAAAVLTDAATAPGPATVVLP